MAYAHDAFSIVYACDVVPPNSHLKLRGLPVGWRGLYSYINKTLSSPGGQLGLVPEDKGIN